jgi:2-hydroxychromene-2-carboxylate isomerase
VTPRFSVTWDYRCPFARIVHRHIVDALLDGADWDVTFVPFSLGQVHVEDGEPPIWDRPDDDTGLLALQAAVAVRDARRDVFPLVHRALFEARHVDGAHLRDEAVVRDLLTTNGADADAVMAEVASGRPLATIRDEHTAAAKDFDVWGVPTFIAGGRAVFIRLMDLPTDGADARRTIERCLDMVESWPSLNEFKQTNLDR